MLTHNISGPIFNNFDIGSYLIYRLYPKERVFIDGRPEAYPAEFLQDTYIPMQQDIELFNTVDQKYGFNTIFFSHTDQTPWARSFLQQIINHPQWKPVYLDDYVIIFLKETPANHNILTRYAMKPNEVTFSNLTPNDFQAILRLATFFNIIELSEQELNMYQRALAMRPTYCPVLYNAGLLLSQQEDPAANIYIQRYRIHCR